KIVWDWVSSSKNILAHYHATSAFLEHPEWILHDGIELLVKTLTRIINQTDDETETSSGNIWHLMSILSQHYQFHIEAAVPGLDSEAAASTACWLADKVTGIFLGDTARIKKIIELW